MSSLWRNWNIASLQTHSGSVNRYNHFGILEIFANSSYTWVNFTDFIVNGGKKNKQKNRPKGDLLNDLSYMKLKTR